MYVEQQHLHRLFGEAWSETRTSTKIDLTIVVDSIVKRTLYNSIGTQIIKKQSCILNGGSTLELSLAVKRSTTAMNNHSCSS